MVNINLSTGGLTSQAEGLPYKKGIITIFSVAFLLCGVYGGIIFYRKDLSKKTDSAGNSYRVEYEKLTGESNKKVIDFQNRLAVAKKAADQRSIAKETLLEMEKNILNNVYILSYELDAAGKILALSCVADNFNLVAQQVLAFKKTEYFSNVTLGNAKVDNNGKIEFEVSLKIK